MNGGAQPTKTGLPIGVLLPTYNSREDLEAHLASMQNWWGHIEEIVVVDSQSADGTLDYLKKHLPHPRTNFLSHSPGLYESWNYGIRHIQSPYTYIATVGDTIQWESLSEMVAVAEKEGADAVVSPPQFVDSLGNTLDKSWPIHHFMNRKQIQQAKIISPCQWFGWTVAFLPESLLGSSASNLYRTEYIHARPFPLGYGHACDTAWAIANAFKARIAMLPRATSVFRVHKATQELSREDHLRLMKDLTQLSLDVLNSHLPTDQEASSAFPMCQLTRNLLEDLFLKFNFRMSYRNTRLPWCPWFLQPSARKFRSIRKVVRNRIPVLREALLSELTLDHF